MTGVIDPGMAGNWTLEPERSSVTFVARTLWGMAPVKGRFTAVTGEGHITTGGKVSGRLVIQADSVRTGIGMRDRHLRAPDFFDAANHAEIVVAVTDIDTSGQLIATLTIRGTTLPIPLQATVDWLGEDSLKVSARAEVDRTRWGVNGNMLRMMPPDTLLHVDAVFVR